MRKLLISVAVISLFALPALAQDDHGHGGGGGEHGGGAPHGGGPAPQAQHGGPPGGGHGGGAPHGQPGPNPGFSRGPNGGGFDHHAPQAAPSYNRGPNGGGGFHGGPRNGVNPGGPNMAGRPGGGFHGGPGGGHHDFHSFGDYHQNFNASRHFHAGAYIRPQGWYPHRWVFGEVLPPLFWARNYWLMDFMDFGLPPPPPYAVWVRYGNDALLIDQDSGEIITVEYGVFY